MKYLSFLLAFFLVLVNPALAAVSAPDFALEGEEGLVRLSDYKGKTLVLYFFSFSCGHCEKAMPIIQELHKKSGGKYEILGVVYGIRKEELKEKKIEAGIEFAFAIGSAGMRREYKVSGTPYFWVIGPDGALKERFVGERGAGLLQTFLEGYSIGKDRLGIFELASDINRLEGQNIVIGGGLVQTSPLYFPNPAFMLTNGTDKVQVSPWLPLETAPPPRGSGKKRKQVMSDFLGRYVTVSGKVASKEGKLFVEVKHAKAFE